jgi:hypothetical protein
MHALEILLYLRCLGQGNSVLDSNIFRTYKKCYHNCIHFIGVCNYLMKKMRLLAKWSRIHLEMLARYFRAFCVTPKFYCITHQISPLVPYSDPVESRQHYCTLFL